MGEMFTSARIDSLLNEMSTQKARVAQLEAALVYMHETVHHHIYRCGEAKGIPDSRVIGIEALRMINVILARAMGRDHESLKYYNLPDNLDE